MLKTSNLSEAKDVSYLRVAQDAEKVPFGDLFKYTARDLNPQPAD